MKLPLNGLDVDLLIENGGHQVQLTGSGTRYVAKFLTFVSILHFARVSWEYRKLVPRDVSLRLEWRRFRMAVKFAMKGNVA